jgi:hypothetical protein
MQHGLQYAISASLNLMRGVHDVAPSSYPDSDQSLAVVIMHSRSNGPRRRAVVSAARWTWLW